MFIWAHDPWDTRVHSGRELADTVTWSSKHHTDYKLAMTRVFKLSEPTHKWHTSFTKTISPQCTQTVPPAGTRYSNARDAGDVCHKTHRNKVTVLAAFNYRFLYAFNVKKQELGAGLCTLEPWVRINPSDWSWLRGYFITATANARNWWTARCSEHGWNERHRKWADRRREPAETPPSSCLLLVYF